MASQLPRKRPKPKPMTPSTYLNTLKLNPKPRPSEPQQPCNHQEPPKNQLSVTLLFQCLIMENFRPPFTPSTTTTSSSSPSSTLGSSTSQLYHPEVCYLPSHLHWPQPPCSPYPPPMIPVVPSLAALNKRMARERRSGILRTKKAARAAAASSRLAVEEDTSTAVPETQNEPYLYSFCTPDNKKLRLLFKKELKNSDVGSLGRIVLPKREAEKYLPSLPDKEGIELRIRDALSTQELEFKYKLMAMPSIGQITKVECMCLKTQETLLGKLESGWEIAFIFMKMKARILKQYVSIHKDGQTGEGHVDEPSSTSHHQRNHTETRTNTAIDNAIGKRQPNTTSIFTPDAYNETRSTDEDKTSSGVILQQRNEQLVETNSIVTLFADPSSSYRRTEEASNSNNDVIRQQQTSTQPTMSEDNFSDCYEGLGTLPEVDHFEHSLFDFDEIIRDNKKL